jgi:hypothetical protein
MPFETKTWVNGIGQANARLNDDALNDLEDRIDDAVSTGIVIESANGHETSFHAADATHNGTTDPCGYFGYNVAGTGGQRDAGENSLWIGVEGDYEDDSGVHWSEINVDYWSSAGVSKRFYAFGVNRSTNAGHHRFIADHSQGFAIDGVINRNNFLFQPGTVSERTTTFRYTGGSGEYLQIGGEGGSAPSRMYIGPTMLTDNNGIIIRNGGLVGIGTDQGGTSGCGLNLLQCTSAPGSGETDVAQIYVDESGGKHRLMVRFPTGAAQQFAIEP